MDAKSRLERWESGEVGQASSAAISTWEASLALLYEKPAPPSAASAIDTEEILLTMGMCLAVEKLISEKQSDGAKLACFSGKPTAGLAALHHFVGGIITTCMFTPECCVLSFVLVTRILKYHQVRLTWHICNRLLLVAFVVSQKFWDDFPLGNVDFTIAWSRVVPHEQPLTIAELGLLECVFLGALGFDVFVTYDEYQSVRDELLASASLRETTDAKCAAMCSHHARIIANRGSLWYKQTTPTGRRTSHHHLGS